MGSIADWRLTRVGRKRLSVQAGQYWVYNQALESNRFITNNYQAGLGYSFALNRRWLWQNEGTYISYVANKTRLAQIRSGMRYQAWNTARSTLYFVGGFGAVNDKRLQFNNSGPSFFGEASLAGVGHDTLLTYRFSATGFKAFIEPRKNELYSGSLQVSKDFGGKGLLSGEGGYLRRKVEDFLGTDIQSIISDTVFGRVRFQYGLSDHLTFTSDNQILTPNRAFFYRNVETQNETRNVRYFQDEYQTTNSLLFLNKRLKASLSVDSKQRNRTYDIINRNQPGSPGYFQQMIEYGKQLEQERIKDIREKYLTYTADLKWKLASKHVLKANYVAQLLRVDTRSLLNNQDRDEILYAGELTHEWRLRPGFLFLNKISGSLRHFIFIEASQSSENFKDRIIRWEPGFRWNIAQLTLNSQMGIWATYQVRDFESVQDKNRSNRVLIFNNQATYTFSARWKLFADALRRENRLSQLNWGNFSESPIDTVTIYDLSLRTQYQQTANQNTVWSVQAGYRAFWQVRKSKASLTDPAQGARLIFLRHYIVQQGPQLKVLWQASQRWEFMSEFWLQWTSQYYRYQEAADVYIGSSYTSEQLAFKDRRFLPYFTVKGLYFLR